MQGALAGSKTKGEFSRGCKTRQIALATLCTAIKSMQQRWAHKQVRPNTTLNQTTLYCASVEGIALTPLFLFSISLISSFFRSDSYLLTGPVRIPQMRADTFITYDSLSCFAHISLNSCPFDFFSLLTCRSRVRASLCCTRALASSHAHARRVHLCLVLCYTVHS